jgi:hypothetical protein
MMSPDTPVAFQMPALSKHDCVAIKALSVGEATPEQQVAAMAAIIKKVSNAYQLQFVPGSSDESTFLAGRAFVGLKITRIINEPVPDQ